MMNSRLLNKFKSRALAFTLALALVAGMLPVQSISAATKTESTLSESETDENDEYERIEIKTADDFAKFSANCYIDSWSKNKYVVLMNDINLSDTEYTPVAVFNGIFDGEKHTISGFDYVGDGYVVGLFRYIESDGIVKNLNLKGTVESENEKECIGSICGVNYGSIKNCTFQGTVSGRDTVGGIAGINESSGLIGGCTVKGRVTGYYSTGGITGINHGTLNYCTNRAGINDDSAWVEEDDEMGGVEIVKSLVSNDDSEVYSGVDTGGITGYSDGLISRCTNSGTVGYEHTGYNIGGIAGRQAGVVSLSTNNGIVYGRKDVGGIVGQMEPYIEIDEAESLRNAINKLHDLIEKTLNDMDDSKDVLKSDVDTMQSYADSAIDTGDLLADQLTDFVNVNLEEINDASDRLDHIMDMVPDVLDNISEAGDAMSRLNDIMGDVTDDLKIFDELDDSPYNETDYNRISLLSTVGGSLSTDSINPKEGDTVTITVEPDDGYKLSRISVTDASGNSVSISPITGKTNKYGFVMPAENVKVEAEFSYAGGEFFVRSDVGGNVTKTVSGDAYTFIATPDNGYNFDGYELSGINTTVDLSQNSITLNKSDISDGHSAIVSAKFSKTNNASTITYTTRAASRARTTRKNNDISVVTGTGGTATATPSSAVEGTKITVKVTPDNGYSVNTVKINDDILEASDTNEYTFKMPNEDANVEVTFKYYDVDNDNTKLYSESNAGGKIEIKPLKEGNYEIKVIPSTGYIVYGKNIKIIGDKLSSTNNGEKNNDSNIESGKDDENISDIGNNGTSDIDDDSDSNEENDDSDVGGAVDTVESDAASDGSYTFEVETSDYDGPVMVYATFESLNSNTLDQTVASTGTSHSITYVSSTGGGFSTSNPTHADSDSQVTVKLSLDSDYVLKSLTVNSSSGADAVKCSTSGNDYTFTMPDEDVTVEAQFEPMYVILTSNLGGDASISISGNDKVKVTISPSSGYTLESTPTITDAVGNRINATKYQSDSYVFDYSNVASLPCTVKIAFAKQNQRQAINQSKDGIENSVNDLAASAEYVQESVSNIRNIVIDDDGNYKDWDTIVLEGNDDVVIDEVIKLATYLGDMSSSASSILRNLTTIYNVVSPYVIEGVEAVIDDIDRATDEVEIMINSLKAAHNNVKGIVNYINGQPTVKFTTLGSDFDATKESFHDQLKGLSDSIRTLSDNAADSSGVINDDLRAVNDQLNVVLNLLADRLVDVEDLSIDELYEEVKDEDIDSITTGRVDICTNKGTIQGDINVGGIAGSMSIDDEDPEDSAAGEIEYEIGRRFITKCLVTESVNEGFVTSKKDGAGGICGYMNHGIIVDSESYGSVESTEGDYVGGICGESLTIIKRCYSLCSVSGGQNVGGIAGYAQTLTDCYSMSDVTAENGRVGAIAGQVATYEEVESENGDSPEVSGNFYVSDDLYGIDNISYVGVAEPISYNELLEVENLPTEFWHLKVIYMIEGTYLGSQELKYGEKLNNLTYPSIPAKDGYYGVWPDVSDRKMNGTVVVEAEYKDNVTVVQSSGEENEKPIALVEDKFTEDTQLIARVSNFAPPEEAEGSDNVVYELVLENAGIHDGDTFAVRLLNPYDEATVYGYVDGAWSQMDSKTRGQYLQVTMTGDHEYFCIVNDKSYTMVIIGCAAAGAVLLILLIVLIKKGRERRKNKKSQNNEENIENHENQEDEPDETTEE